MKFFQRFDKVFCVSLQSRKDRLQNFKNQVSKFDLGEFEVFDAIDGNKLENKTKLKNGEIGLIESIILILQNSIENNYKSILIIEDDCEFKENINSVDDYFKQLPSDWNMIYFGGNHARYLGVLPLQVSNNILKLKNTHTTHCVAFNSDIINVVLERIKMRDRPLDEIYTDIQREHNVYGFIPGVATQKVGYSDIQRLFVNYNSVIE